MEFKIKKTWVPQAEKTHEIPDELVPSETRKVLLLEDDMEFAMIVRDFLQDQSFRVTVVGSGVEGLKRILAENFDVIVCDMVMPNFPGNMFYLAVQKARPHLCKRFVFMTGHRGDAKIDAFVRSIHGMMLFKPFEMRDLIEAMNAVIRRAESGKA